MISNKCLAALKSYKQADNEGVMVLVSREAIDEAIAALTAATSGGVDDGYYLASFKEKRNGAPILWWGPNNAGYSTDLEQAGVYTELKPGYHDSEHTVPVPVSFIRTLRIRREVDPGDTLNAMFWTADKLRAALTAALKDGGGA